MPKKQLPFNLEPQAARVGPQASLKHLDQVPLNDRHASILAEAMETCDGEAETRNRKHAEARELLALAQIAQRLEVQWLRMEQDLRALITMQARVACWPPNGDEPVVVDHTVVGFTYPSEGFRRPLPGYAFFQILLPRGVWLPQVRQPEQVICIAPSVPAGMRTSRLLMQLYGALTMQSIQFDIENPAGVFDAACAEWWQHNMHRVPLTKTPFLASDDDDPSVFAPEDAIKKG